MSKLEQGHRLLHQIRQRLDQMTGIKCTKKQLIKRWRELNQQMRTTASTEEFAEIVKERYRLVDIAERMGVELPMD